MEQQMRKDAQAKGSSHRLAASKAKHDLQVGEAGWKAYKTNMASRYQQLKDRYVHLKNKYRRLRVLIKQEIDLRAEQKQRPDGNTSVHPRHGNPSDQNEMKDEGGLSGSASKSHGSAPVDMPGQKRGNPPILSAKERGIKECPGVAERSPGMPSSDFMKTEGGKKNTNSTGKQQRSKGKLALNDMSNAPRPANGRPCAETPSSISVTCNAGMPNLNCKECEEFYKAAGIRPANLRCTHAKKADKKIFHQCGPRNCVLANEESLFQVGFDEDYSENHHRTRLVRFRQAPHS